MQYKELTWRYTALRNGCCICCQEKEYINTESMEITQKYIVEIFVHTHSNPAAGANLVLWRLLILAVLLDLWRSIGERISYIEHGHV